MSLFVDTSAILALVDADQERHQAVSGAWDAALDSGRALYTSNYVLVETLALVQRRLGLAAARDVSTALMPLLSALWVDETLHETALAAVLAAGSRGLSLVDCTSFEIMRRHGLGEALTLDHDFARQGFRVAPAPGARNA
ncbi:MAG: PIN domain-containing protein [Gammaproteobacteria bacterium]|nr:PIN domain-containing protein [Gammaproteobacteria bacterium]